MNTDATAAAPPPYEVWDRVRVSKDFFNLLFQHPVFQAEPKAINTAQYWLTAIDAAMSQKDDEAVPWVHEDIQNRFQGFTQSHTKFRDALRDDLKLITFTRYKIPPSGMSKGKCRRFTVTPLGRQLIRDANYEWLYKLLNDPKTRRRNQVAISKRKSTRIVYTDPMMQIIDELHHGVKFQKDGLLNLLQRQKAEAPDRFGSALHHLLALEHRKFKELKRKEGRIFNRFVALPSEYRPLAIYKGKSYIATADIRACHPTFLGKLLLGFYHEEAPAISAGVNQQAFERECREWTDFFVHPTIDPREVIKAEAGIPLVLKDVKEGLNTWLNGAKKFKRRTDKRWDYKNIRRLEAWFQSRFPEMARVWAAMEDRRITGTSITEEYEGPLMLDPALYALGDELGLTLAYEYDGVGVFAEPNDPVWSAKLEKVRTFIQRQSVKRFGVAVVVKVKDFKSANR